MHSPDRARPQPSDGLPSDVSGHIDRVEEQVGARTLLPLRIRNTLRLRGTSVTVPGTRVDIGITCRDANDRGSFAAGTGPHEVVVEVNSFVGRHDEDQSSRRGATSTPIPGAEAEAWIRVVLGQPLADYAYELAVAPIEKRRPFLAYRRRFAVLIDGEGRPILAPDNIRWPKHIDVQLPRKLEPRAENTCLRSQLAASGPYTESAPIRDPSTEPDGGWRIEVCGDRLDTLTSTAREAVEEARRQFRIRGDIHTDLQAERLIVDGQTLHLQFRWRKNPHLFSIRAHIPQSDDEFRSPAIDPRAWISYTCDHWMEELSTGWVRWARREMVDGVTHLGRRDEPERHGYNVAIAKGLRPDADGFVHIHHSPHQQEGTFTDLAFTEQSLISYSYATQRPDGAPPRLVAQAVTVWTANDAVASLDILDVLPGTPDHAVWRTAFHVLHDAADAGVRTIITALDHPILDGFGFVAGKGNYRTLDVLSMT